MHIVSFDSAILLMWCSLIFHKHWIPRFQPVEHQITNTEHLMRHPEPTHFKNLLSDINETTKVHYLISQTFFFNRVHGTVSNVTDRSQLPKKEYYCLTLISWHYTCNIILHLNQSSWNTVTSSICRIIVQYRILMTVNYATYRCYIVHTHNDNVFGSFTALFIVELF